MICDFYLLFKGKDNPWLVHADDGLFEEPETLFLELRALAVLCLPSGECLCPDPSVCASLMSALYSSASEEEVLKRQLTVNFSIVSPLFTVSENISPIYLVFHTR